MKKIILCFLFVLTPILFGEDLHPTKYIELVNAHVEQFETNGDLAKLFDETIDSTGYSEIRVFVHVFVDNYKETPVRSNTGIDVSFFHEANGSWTYAQHKLKSSVTSYVCGLACEKVIGNRVRVVGFPEEFPKGPYTITVTCYLVR